MTNVSNQIITTSSRKNLIIRLVFVGLSFCIFKSGNCADFYKNLQGKDCVRSCSTPSYCVEQCYEPHQNTPNSGGQYLPPIVQEDSYGAIFLEQNNPQRMGLALHKRTKEIAIQRALEACQQKAFEPNLCTFGLWFKNSCGAIATSNNGMWGTAADYSALKAKKMAVSKCEDARSGTRCYAVSAYCTGE